MRRSDEQQLRWAAAEDRAIYTYNAADFCRLHAEFLRQHSHHAGIIIGDQQALSIGEEIRRLLRLGAALPATKLRNRLEFLSNWKS